jgi:hypothetical protein
MVYIYGYNILVIHGKYDGHNKVFTKFGLSIEF